MNKKKSNVPRVKRMNQASRMESAKHWLSTYKRLEKAQHVKEQLEASCYSESDETYAYIAGYTNWGFPYGITWEEMERIADEESLFESIPPEHLTKKSAVPR